MSRILVTGGLGFIGHNVVRRLLDQGHEITVTDTRTDYGIVPQDELDYLMEERLAVIPEIDLVNHRVNISDCNGVAWMMRHYQPDTVLHLASFPRQKVVNVNPQLGSRAMSEGLLNLLDNSVAHGVRRFVYVSSSMVYGDFQDNIREDAQCRPRGQYGIMKLAGEWLVRDYTERTGLEHVIVRPSAVYGPRDAEDRVVSKFLLAAMRSEAIQVNGAAEALDFTHVDDLANGLALATVVPAAANNTYNITRGRSRALLEAADEVVKIVGQGVIQVNNRDTGFPSRGALNIDKARQDLGFDPKVDIEEGFQNYYRWLTDSIYWSKKTVQ